MAEWEQKFKDAVAPRLDEEPLAAGHFQRAGQYLLAIPVIGQLGLVFYLAYQAVNKKRAAGLPMNFLLAVTPTKVHAFKYKPGGYGNIKIGDEVASWNRADITVAARSDGPMASKITFETSENGHTERMVCNAPMLSKNPMSSRVLELIGGAAA
jgi:hypothetical protein